jgi:hypothetical protein
MIAVCAWCGKQLGLRGVESGITHGICAECRARIVREHKLEKLGGENRRGNQDSEIVENGGATEREQGSGAVRSIDPGRNPCADGKGVTND